MTEASPEVSAEASILNFFRAIDKKASNPDKDLLDLNQFQLATRQIFSEKVNMTVEGIRTIIKINSSPHRKAVKYWNRNAEQYLIMAFAGQHYPKFLKYYLKDDLDDDEWPQIPCGEIHAFAKEFVGSDQQLFPQFFPVCFEDRILLRRHEFHHMEFVAIHRHPNHP